MEETEKTPAVSDSKHLHSASSPHDHHHRHGHGHGHPHRKCVLKDFAPGSLMYLMYEFGHKFHHTPKEGMTEENFFGALDAQEKTQLAALLQKARDGWKKEARPKPQKQD